MELHTPADRWLGQVLSLDVARVDAGEIRWTDESSLSTTVTTRVARGEGAILSGAGEPFHDAVIRPAAPETVRTWLRESAPRRALLPAGELLLASGVTLGLDAGGFNRHTSRRVTSGRRPAWWCIAPVGPATSGCGCGWVSSAAAARPRRYGWIRSRIARSTRSSRRCWTSRAPAKLDDLERIVRPGAEALTQRLRNLGVDRWGVWAREDAGSTLDALDDPAVRCLVVDLASLGTPQEQSLVAEAVLERLWRLRNRREPMLIVIDEAHNVCPARPEGESTALATEHAVRIAAEGRKFGLYLLASTQRPQKVHENVVSQCDNLVLMRMNSAADLAYAADVFSFVPPGLLARAAGFGLGEALVAGKLAPHPALVRFGARIAEEGGADVPADWASMVAFPT